MTDILQGIAAYKREEVRHRKAGSDAGLLRSRADADRPRGFLRALRAGAEREGVALIAEIKRASPSKGLIRADFDPPALALAYERGGASCLSVLTDAPSFQGSEAFLVSARAAAALPVIRKDFLVDPWQVLESRALGADAVLVIMAMVDDALASDLMQNAEALGMDALVEVHDRAELERALRLGAVFVGVNNRDLRTFETRLQTTAELAAEAPSSVFLVSESGLFTSDEVREVGGYGARAVLVGESLMREEDVEAATRRLLGR